MDFSGPCFFNIRLGFFEAREELGGNACTFVERQLQRGAENVVCRSRHEQIVTSPSISH